MLKMKLSHLVPLFIAFLFFAGAAQAEDPQYIGVQKCKKCHKKEKIGKQFLIWQEKPHAKAFETLGTDTAKIVAKTAGVEGDPQKAPECLKCHVTAYEEDAAKIAKSFKPELGIQCESCHGPGSLYKKKKIMKDLDKAKSLGLIIPDEETCKKCHNKKSPTFKEFNYEERLEKIKHPVPGKEKAK